MTQGALASAASVRRNGNSSDVLPFQFRRTRSRTEIGDDSPGRGENLPLGTLGMAERSPQHQPVLVERVLELLEPKPKRVLLDGTVGMGGHAEAWMEQSGGRGYVIGLDRDASALTHARLRLARYGDRVVLVHGNYKQATELCEELGRDEVDAVLVDLGLGSHQLDDRERGFSFRYDSLLDMRFDRDQPGPTAAEILAQASEPELVRILSEYGEERGARKLAHRIVEVRGRRPIRTTFELANLVRETLPAGRQRLRIDPATKTFQALRIAVNQELAGLEEALERLVELLRPGGRIVVISFHSLEDRIVKRTLRRLALRVHRQPDDPPETIREPLIDMPQRRVTMASEEEILANPRSRSARLRWGVRR